MKSATATIHLTPVGGGGVAIDVVETQPVDASCNQQLSAPLEGT